MSEIATDANGPSRRQRRGSWIFRDPRALIGVAVLTGAVVCAIAAPLLTPYGPFERVGPIYGPPSASHPLGLDDVGQDVLTQLLYGARTSLVVGLSAALVAALVGGVVGIAAGYFGGRREAVLMGVTEYVLILPGIPLMIAVSAIFGTSFALVVLLIGLLSWPQTARVLRSQVKSLRERTFIRRARVVGVGPLRMIRSHVLPHVAPLLMATLVLSVAQAIFLETALTFLGLGSPGRISWGSMIYDAFERNAVSFGAWWALLYPGLAVTIVVLACTLIGQALEDKLNPRARVAFLSPRRFKVERAEASAVGPLDAPRLGGEAPLLEIDALDVWLSRPTGPTQHAVCDVSLRMGTGDRFALVGESGSGKTTTLMSILGLLPANARARGHICYKGSELLSSGGRYPSDVRWKEIAVVFQGSMNSFSPVHTIGSQIAEPMRLHTSTSRRAARADTEELLESVGLESGVWGRYPHELSGGMRQRAAIAMALSCDPKLLLADEPTTALDAVVQAQILQLLSRLASERDLAVLLVTHDLASVSLLCDSAAVMKNGAIVERGPVERLYHAPEHEYTKELFGAVVDLHEAAASFRAP